MAQHYWSAEDHAVGDVPSEWDITNATIEIAEDSDGRKYLDVTGPDNERSFLEFVPAANTVDGEVWVRWLTDEWTDAWAFLRGQSIATPSTVSMTRTNYAPANDVDGLAEFNEGVYRSITTQELTTPADTIGQMRGSFSDDTLQGRWWTDGNAEPSTWDLTGTTMITGSGASGIGHWAGSELRIYEFGVGTSGDSAPSGITTRTRTIGGTFVDGTATPQPGATITVLNDDNDPPTVVGTTTTDSGGNWSLDVTPGITVHCLAEWVDGNGTQYQTESKPFIAVGGGGVPNQENLVAHWDFSSVDATDGEAYVTVPDLSENGYDLTGNGATHDADGINGLPAARFDGTDDYLTAPGPDKLNIANNETTKSVYLVWRSLDANHTGYLMTQTNNGSRSLQGFSHIFYGGRDEVDFDLGGEVTPNPDLLDTTPHTTAALIDRPAGEATVSWDGVTQETTTGTEEVENAPVRLGARGVGTTDLGTFYHGLIGEVLIYDGVHDISTHDAVMDYLSRWSE